MKIDGNVKKKLTKPWVLAPTLSKTMGTKAPIATILTRALLLYNNLENLGCTQGSKFKTNQYRKIRLQIFDICCKNVRQMC